MRHENLIRGFFLHFLPPSAPSGLKVNKILLTLVEGTVNQRLGGVKSDKVGCRNSPPFFFFVTNFLTLNPLLTSQIFSKKDPARAFTNPRHFNNCQEQATPCLLTPNSPPPTTLLMDNGNRTTSRSLE